MAEIKRIPAQPEKIQITITLSIEEYDAISSRAAWESHGGIERYLIDCALGQSYRGC